MSVDANLFTFCRSITDPHGAGVSLCGDGVPTATAVRLPVEAGGTVALTTGVFVSAIGARYAAAGGSSTTDLAIAPLDTSGRRFAVALPAGAPPALMLVSIEYRDVAAAGGARESGDAHFSIGLKAYRRPRPTAVTVHARARCEAAPDRARRCRLSQRGRIHRKAGSDADCRGGRVRVTVFGVECLRLRGNVG
ncbi:MAG: hypothetical protein LC790_07765 [Actinobacteria bacterium]|nr:hypothetical protein [Actinomycetota bacterium]